jgi:hypothetical protein
VELAIGENGRRNVGTEIGESENLRIWRCFDNESEESQKREKERYVQRAKMQ